MADGHEVVTIDNLSLEKENISVSAEFYELDLRDYEEGRALHHSGEAVFIWRQIASGSVNGQSATHE